MTYTLDVEMFISEVKKYPEIWDMNHADHRFMKKKQAAWEEIAKIFISDFEDMSDTEKNDVFKKLNSKWRNIRDSYVRSTRRSNGSGYMYAKHLTFLYNLYNNRTPTSDSEADADEQNSWSEDSATKKTRYKKSRLDLAENFDEETSSALESLRRKRSLHDAIEYVETPLIPDGTSCNATEDEDKSFFDSLLPAVRHFNMDQKLEFRSEVILLIKKIRNSCTEKLVKQDIDFDTTYE